MRRNNLIVGLLLMLLATVSSSGEFASPEGLWKTYDDDGKITGFVRIVNDNGIYTGVIEKGLDTDKGDERCTACKDERKDRKLIGMTIMKKVKANGDAYVGEEILDPFSGNTYKVTLKLKEAGKKLEVRGYIGLSLFGRTQTWERAENG
jgi:uncharacterized protein (DUF2147 family)